MSALLVQTSTKLAGKLECNVEQVQHMYEHLMHDSKRDNQC